MNGHLAWYVARSAGWVAAILLVVTVAWGVLGIGRTVQRRGWPRWIAAMHRHIAMLAVVMVAVHIGALVADNYIHIGWSEVLVPLAIAWKPRGVALGIVALYLLFIVQVSSIGRHRLSRRLWRSLHWFSYLLVPAAIAHGVIVGSDTNRGVLLPVVGAIVGLTAFLVIRRALGLGAGPASDAGGGHGVRVGAAAQDATRPGGEQPAGLDARYAVDHHMGDPVGLAVHATSSTG